MEEKAVVSNEPDRLPFQFLAAAKIKDGVFECVQP